LPYLRQGTINVTPRLKSSSSSPTTASMDGDMGLGFVVGYHAMNDAITRAERYGSGFVTVRNSSHFGAAAYYAMMALPHNMIGLALTSTWPGVVSPDGTSPSVGTNPLAIAVPADKKPPFVLDMATSVVAGGKLEIARRQEASIPEGWAIDGEGKPLTDPGKTSYGLPTGGLLPLGGMPETGGYKGFGLGVAIDILCSLLSGAGPNIFLSKLSATPGNPFNHFFGAISIAGFLPVDEFKRQMDRMTEAFEALPTVPGVKKVYLAGGPEAEIARERKASGIPLDRRVIQTLKDLSIELDIEYDLK
jgi:L-2-hydroxycarboxylate dehydrogenase (NAD+)